MPVLFLQLMIQNTKKTMQFILITYIELLFTYICHCLCFNKVFNEDSCSPANCLLKPLKDRSLIIHGQLTARVTAQVKTV